MDYENLIIEFSFIISFLALVVSVVTEVTKNLPLIKKVPTQLYVVLLSIIITEGFYIGFSLYKNMPITFFFVFSAFFGSFFVALVSMSGWNSVKSIYERVSSGKK